MLPKQGTQVLSLVWELRSPMPLLLLLLLSRFSHVRLCATPWMAAYQAPPSLGFSRQEHWSGLPMPLGAAKKKNKNQISFSVSLLLQSLAALLVSFCPFPRNGNPLQCSCLEDPRDGGAWWAAVYGVAQSRTRPKRLSSSSKNS